MQKVPEDISQKIEAYILRDMNPSWLLMWGKTFLAFLVGGGASLFICEQFGFGLTPFARSLGDYFHTNFDEAICGIFCATMFTVLPPLLLRAMSSYLQFKMIVKKGYYIGPIWLVALGGLMSIHGEEGMGLYHNIVWVVAAVFFYQLLLMLVSKIEFKFWVGPADIAHPF